MTKYNLTKENMKPIKFNKNLISSYFLSSNDTFRQLYLVELSLYRITGNILEYSFFFFKIIRNTL